MRKVEGNIEDPLTFLTLELLDAYLHLCSRDEVGDQIYITACTP